MASVYINELGRHSGQTVTVRGWVVTTRSSGKIAFLVLRDGTGYLQAVFPRKGVSESVWGAFGTLTHETSVAVTGQVREDARSPGGYELAATGLEVIGASVDFPITPKEHGTQFLFEHRHLWLRSRRQMAIAKVRHVVVQAIHDFFDLIPKFIFNKRKLNCSVLYNIVKQSGHRHSLDLLLPQTHRLGN